MSQRVRVSIPGDEPVQIAGSPHLDRLQELAEIDLHCDRPVTDDEKVRRVGTAEILINSRGSVKWSGAVLRQLPRLKLISLCGIGTDCIDLDAARELGITVCNIPGRTAGLVAEHALALLMACARWIPQHTLELRQGQWVRRDLISLRGKRLGVVGTGAIGREMIRLGRAIGMEVVAWTFHPQPHLATELGFRYVGWEELLRTSDAVSLHLKLTADSRGLLGEEAISQLKPGVLLINTARGAIVPVAPLVRALQSGHIGAAGLDVFETEPLGADHPLLACPNAILTPHCADQTPEGMDILNGGAVDNVLAYLRGTPQNIVV